jgi:MscS family membrane protein
MKHDANLLATLNIFNTIAKIIIVSITVMIILDKMGVNISGILTIGGIGGIALGLAGKDLFANFFGFFVIILDQPFKVGDLISSTDREIKGVVEKISWRVTKVINMEKRPLYIPNSLFTTIIVQNESRMVARRIKENLKFFYSNKGQFDGFIAKINNFLIHCKELNKNFNQMIYLVKVGETIVEFEVVLFTKTKDFKEFTQIKQSILLEIVKISENFNLKPIFPDSAVAIYKNI